MVVLLRPDEFTNVRMQVFAYGSAVIDHRVDQVLKRELWPSVIAGVVCGGRSETATTAFALDTYASGIKPELAGIPV